MSHQHAIKQIEDLISAQAFDEALTLIDRSLEKEEYTKERYQNADPGSARERYQLANAKVTVYLSQNQYQQAQAVYQSGIFRGISTLPERFASPEYLDYVYNAMVMHGGLGNTFLAERSKYIYHHFNHESESRAFIEQIKSIAVRQEENVLTEMDAGQVGIADLKQLLELYIVQSEGIDAYVALTAIADRLSRDEIEDYQKALWLIGVVEKQIPAGTNVNIFVEAVQNDSRSRALAHMAASGNAGGPVHYIKYPLLCEVESLEIEKADILDIILNNKITEGNVTYYVPLLLTDTSGNCYDTTSIILGYVTDRGDNKVDHFARIDETRLPGAHDMNLLGLQHGIRYRESYWQAEFDLPDRPRMCLVEIYNKIKKYSKAYGFDIIKSLEEPPTCKISIVIPTRNCPETLRYTLLSCLDQDYEDYEIVLSDNGDPGDEAVLELAEELNAKCMSEGRSPKIKYYHTPGLLPLPKSFEYAYLQARGEFLFGLGSDDAVMPGSLRVLAQCLDENPDAEVIQWKSILYYWPDMTMGQSDYLSYNPAYKRGEYEATPVHSAAILMTLLSDSISLYRLPVCYINSGMRRRYIKKIIDKTGTFIGGASQDIYIGLLNLYLNKEILCMDYPIAIAGQGGRSIGAKAFIGTKSSEEQQKQIKEYREFLIMPEAATLSQAKMPATNWDKTLFINQLLRVQDLNVGRLYGDDNIDFKKMFELALVNLSPIDQNFEMHVSNLLEASKLHGEAFYQWFKPLAEQACASKDTQKQKFINRVESRGKAYKEKTEESGMVVIDASKHGIHDVYAAAKYVFSQMR